MAPPPEKNNRPALRDRMPASPGLWVLIAVACALFLSRGFWRTATTGLADFAAPYAGVRLLIGGGNPYDSPRLIETLSAAGVEKPGHSVAVYPPGSLAAMIPFAPFPAGPARWLMIAAGLGLLACGVRRWARLLSYSNHEYTVAACLLAACAPLHTAMTVANPALLAAGALLSGGALVQSGAGHRGLLLLGFALALKPQLGLIGPLWLAMNGRFRPALWLTFVVGGLHLAVAAALFHHQPSAWFDWLANLRAETTGGSISAETELGFQRIDPAGVWFAVAGTGLSALVSLLLAAGFAFRLWQSGRDDDSASPAVQLGRLGAAGTTLLLAGYHRGYDALVLVPLWLLLIPRSGIPGSLSVRALGLVSLLWILPGAGFWRLLESRSDWVHQMIAPSFFWTAGLLRMHGWVVVVTALLLLFIPPARLSDRRAPAPLP